MTLQHFGFWLAVVGGLLSILSLYASYRAITLANKLIGNESPTDINAEARRMMAWRALNKTTDWR